MPRTCAQARPQECAPALPRRPTLGARAQLGVHHFALPGVIAVAGFREAAVVHIYLKGLHRGGGVALRGFLFAESAERAWQARPGTYGAVATPCARQEGLLLDAPTSVCARQGWGGGYLCQPHVPGSTWPDLFLQCALPWPPCSALPAARPRARSRPLAQPGKAGPGRSGFSNYPCAAACSRDALLQSGRSRREPQASRIGRPVHQAKPAAGAARARRRACGPHRAGRCAASGARCASACCAS